MRKTICLLMAVIMGLTFSACAKRENKADTTVGEGEVMLTGKITEVKGNYMLLESRESSLCDKFSFSFSDEIIAVEKGYYVVDLTADSYLGKTVSVICSESIQETYPAGLSDVRMIITD